MLVPKKGLTQEKDHQTAEKLAAYKAQLTQDEIEDLVRKTRELKEYQEASELPEALKCIPMLSRTDIGREAGHFFNEECYVEDTLLLWHDIQTNGIGYLDLQFDLAGISQELLPYVSLLKNVVVLKCMRTAMLHWDISPCLVYGPKHYIRRFRLCFK